MSRLTTSVVVRHPQSGAPTLLAAGSELPDWAGGLVGDHVLDTSTPEPASDQTTEPVAPPKPRKRPARKTTTD